MNSLRCQTIRLRSVTTSFWHSHGLDSEDINEGQRRDGIDGRENLSDLDFPDDIALLENSWEGMQTMTLTLEEEAKKFVLHWS